MHGNQEPRYCITPTVRGGAGTEHGDLAVALGEECKMVLDPWQQLTVRQWLRTAKDGSWAANTWAISVPRQNGKNGGLEVVELYLMVELGLKILHTSHLLTSARKAFKRLMHFFGRSVGDPGAAFPELNAMVVEIRKTNGQEAIYLSNGGCIELGARTSGAGRGSSFDVLVVDEAQEYEADEQEALEPTISASPSGDPVIIYMGTPPRDISERGAPFVGIRDAAVLGNSDLTTWLEWSAPGDVDQMTEPELRALTRDRRAVADANPALGYRVLEKTVDGERSRMSPRSFARERLNMWPTPGARGVALNAEAWKARAIEDPDEEWPVAAWAVDMNPERTQVTIASAAFADEGRMHLELAADTAYSRDGTTALVEWLWARAGRRVPVVLDSFSPARDILEVPLKKKGMKVFVLSGSEFTQACAMLRRAVEVEKTITHFDQEQLNTSVEHAMSEPVKNFPGSFKWVRTDLEVSLAPLMAITFAFFGATKFGRRSDPEKKRKRHAVVA